MSDKRHQPDPGSSQGENADGSSSDKVKASGWTEEKPKIRSRDFPGPRRAKEPLRIAMHKHVYADLTAHAKESLDAEVCGVLVGELCEDDEGLFVQVEGIIRGAKSRKGSTHVTFTQETWNQIHEEKEKHHRKRQIVGWYHTHPGFGVEFSEMDLFIQRNFFSGPSQIALVIDPLGGQEAILANTDAGPVPVSRFWVDGRERRCEGARKEQEPDAVAGALPASAEKTIKSLEARLEQAMLSIESLQNWFYRVVLTVGMLIAVPAVFWIAWGIVSSIWREPPKPPKPPEGISWNLVPVRVGDKAVLLGIEVKGWQIPEQLKLAYLEQARLDWEAKKKADEAARPASQPAAPAQPPVQGTKP